MILADLFSFVFSAQQGCLVCSGKSFFATTAAYATEGYYMQADILEQIFFNGMGGWAVLAYMIAAIGGLCGVAMGMPPKTYMWFFIGPAVYHWLIGNTYMSYGTQWAAGWEDRNQAQVWKLAKVGLDSSNYAQKYGITTTPDLGPNYPAEVADFFAWFDSVISDTAQQLVEWSGATEIEAQYKVGNIGGADLISGLKWKFMENITFVRIRNPDIRNSMTWFFSGECGKAMLQDGVDAAKYVEAAHSRGNIDPDFTFFDSTFLPIPLVTRDYSRLISSMAGIEVSTTMLDPISRYGERASQGTTFMVQSGVGPLRVAMGLQGAEFNGSMSCVNYFVVLMHLLRYEALQAVNMMYSSVSAAGYTWTPTNLVEFLFHGWDLGQVTTEDEAEQYLVNLTLVNLIRNELPTSAGNQMPDLKFSSGQEIERAAADSASQTQMRSKYAELYNWALMVPQFQGMLLYILAMAYPFACMLVLIPGWWKAIFTWMSFWLWVKLWDVGFALVMVFERSVWASLGNSVDSEKINNVITSMGPLNRFVGTAPLPPLIPGTMTVIPDVSIPLGIDANPSIALFDKAMYLMYNTDFELANAYYVFIMSSLYLAVPPVLAQLVLMSKGAIGSQFSEAMKGIGESSAKNAGNVGLDMLDRRQKEQVALGGIAMKAGEANRAGSLFNAAMATSAGATSADMDSRGATLGKERLGQVAEQMSRTADAQKSQGAYAASTWGAFTEGGLVSNLASMFRGGGGGAAGGGGGAGAGGGAGGGFWGGLMKGGDSWINKAGLPAYNNALTQENLGRMADATGQQAALGNQAAQSSFMASMGEKQAGRLQSGGEWQAELASWRGRQAMGNTVAPRMAAAGQYAGYAGAQGLSGDMMQISMNGVYSGASANKATHQQNVGFYNPNGGGAKDKATAIMGDVQGINVAGAYTGANGLAVTTGQVMAAPALNLARANTWNAEKAKLPKN